MSHKTPAHFCPEIDHECSSSWVHWQGCGSGDLQQKGTTTEEHYQIMNHYEMASHCNLFQHMVLRSVNSLLAPLQWERSVLKMTVLLGCTHTVLWNGLNIKQNQKRRVFYSSRYFPRFNRCLFICEKILKAIQNFYFLLD